MTVRPGIEALLARPPAWLRGRRFAVLTHAAATTRAGRSTLACLRAAFPERVAAAWSPQHGFYGVEQANMVPSADCREPVTGIPVTSLYGDRRRPTPEMFRDIDLVLADLVDVGCRVYTYIWTLTLVMEAAAEAGVPVAVLDRPNPLGGREIEGGLIDPGLTSFVGRYPVPLRHGLTIGELAQYLNVTHGIDCNLYVVPATGWHRAQYGDETGIPWCAPSPNMPTLDTALVYPGQVLFEGTTASEGRGTTLPFQLCGAPGVDPGALMAALDPLMMAGALVRPALFKPMFDKWVGEVCGGIKLQVTDRNRFRPCRAGLELLRGLRRLAGERCAWLPPPYEYEYFERPIDILLGRRELRAGLERGLPTAELTAGWAAEEELFAATIRPFLLYD
ncbi:MAG: DUF1343 domain-containing protein [Deltaproteobacteria bacterium]|nr:DUF1343 domain-containing protein [Candidatus Anaeroferrophillacea bacterium]